MKKEIFIIYLFLVSSSFFAQEVKHQAFKSGEWLHYKMSYSGFLKAGTADLELKESILDGKKVLHAKGSGRTTGLIGWFFKVRDVYESFFDPDTIKPYFFKRDVNEGGHIIRRDIKFDQEKKSATIKDFKHNNTKEVAFHNVQDMISSFYYLRDTNLDTLKVGEELRLDMFFDAKSFPFKLRYLGTEILRTSFGKVKTLKFRPLVQAGRVFKESESVTIWITADKNKIPIRLKASLAVGSLRAELKAFKGLANSFEIIFD